MFNGARIRELRENMNISLAEMAKKIFVSEQTLYEYEQGIVANIQPHIIEKISKELNCSIAYIMGWEKSKEVPSFEPEHDTLINLYSSFGKDEKACFMELASKYALLDTEKKEVILAAVRDYIKSISF